MTAHQYGPHRSEDAPTHCRTQSGDGAPLHPDLIAQRARLNELAHADKSLALAAVPLGAITAVEWATFTAALKSVAVDGLISQTDMRPLIASIAPPHRGQCYRRARRLGLICEVDREESTDHAGGNGDKLQRRYRLGAAA